MIEATVVPRHTWVHGEALCPSCRLPIDKRDVDEELREAGTTQPVGAIVTHRRCGAHFQIEFGSGPRAQRRARAVRIRVGSRR